MKFIMLARNPGLYSHRRIVEAARARGHQIDVINTLHVHMKITSNQAVVRHGGKTLPVCDAVIPRIGASVTHYGLAVLRQFEMQGVFPLNESVAIYLDLGDNRSCAECLSALGGFAAATGRPEEAARGSRPLEYAEPAIEARFTPPLLDSLGPARFADLRAEGRRAGYESALAGVRDVVASAGAE